MMNNTLIKKYRKAKEKLTALHERSEKNATERQDALAKTNTHYRDKIWELESKKREAKAAIQKKHDVITEQLKERMKPEAEEVKAVERLFELLDYEQHTKSKELTFSVSFSGHRGGYHLEQLEEINDTHYTVKVFIIQNDKPKNKYSLVICGKHLFPEKAVQVTRCYGLSIHSDKGYPNIAFLVKDTPNIEALKEYFTKNRAKILNPTLDELSKAKCDLKYAKTLQTSSDFEIELVKWKVNYYETQYSRGTETDEYKNLLEKLAKLQGEGQ